LIRETDRLLATIALKTQHEQQQVYCNEKNLIDLNQANMKTYVLAQSAFYRRVTVESTQVPVLGNLWILRL